MLELRNIIKDYPAGGDTVHALKGIDLSFRSREFVSILGPSGCGKTTMLNIIGGLDGYTSGDLIINGKSTKEYRDKDWDTYRNHSIGFVFQSYNLIPHQTVLRNVELALTLSGVKGASRKRKAAEALAAVGLADQLNKRPSEMSGGQMQRVAIARALVNDPEIILLDEPTGALDTETGIMIMEILKKVASDRLVIMVTHNPELAERYSTRIVRMLDGRIISDSKPLSRDEIEDEKRIESLKAAADAKKKIPRMSFPTAFGLSLNNLFTKRGRTILTAFAGSIGIIGIALIYAVSQGTENYIDTVQQDALSSYPLTITAETADMATMMTAFAAMNKANEEVTQAGLIEEVQVTADILQGIGTNDLRSFKSYLEDRYEEIKEDVNTVRYTYSVSPRVYTLDVNGDLLRVNPSSVMRGMTGGMSFGSFMGGGLFSEMLDDPELISSQYDIISGRLPERYDELLIVLTDKSHVTDFLEYSIGLKDPEELRKMIKSVMSGETVEFDDMSEARTYTPEELMDIDLRLFNVPDLYRYNPEFGVWEDMTGDNSFMRRYYDVAERLKVVGIVAPAPGSSSSALSPGICYLPSLTLHMMENSASSDMVRRQLLNRENDVISGKSFDDLNKENSSALDLDNMISVDSDMIASAFNMDVDTDLINGYISTYVREAVGNNISLDNTIVAEAEFTKMLADLSKGLTEYIIRTSEQVLPDEEETVTGEEETDSSAGSEENEDVKRTVLLKREEIPELVNSFLQTEDAVRRITDLASEYKMQKEMLDTPVAPLFINALYTYLRDFPVRHADVWNEREEYAEKGIILDSETALFAEWSEDEIRYAATASELAAGVIPNTGRLMNASLGAEDVMDELSLIPQKLMGVMAGSLRVDAEKMASAFKFNLSEEELARIMSAYSTTGSRRSYEGNLLDLGYSDPDDPSSIIVYLKDFDGKENFISFIHDYNDAAEGRGEDEKVIRYTDMTGILMSSVKKILDAITYVLIAFVSISLIVSSIMIGVITLISVQERTKEIGILRAIGASKGNVSSMFNAETVIIGFMSGIIGTGVTYLLCIPINAILHKITGISSLSAVLPVPVAGILVMISTMLTLFAGIIPSASAAKKDPVVALRTE